MTYYEVENIGHLLAEKNGCTLHRVDNGAKHVFWMHSDKTGDHSITKDDSLFDDRIKAHWQGFTANQ